MDEQKSKAVETVIKTLENRTNQFLDSVDRLQPRQDDDYRLAIRDLKNHLIVDLWRIFKDARGLE